MQPLNESGFWRSEQGRQQKAQQRMTSALRLALPIEPRSKRSSRNRDRDQLAELIQSGAKPWLELRGRLGTMWPRTRAHIALDIHVSSNRKSSPRIDTICKWLLDELGGPNRDAIVFKDDKQVKLLFARKDVRSAPPDFGDRVVWGPGGVNGDPVIYVTAQRLSLTLEGVRSARALDPPWDPAKVETSPFIADEFEREADIDFLGSLRPELGGFDKEQWERVSQKVVFDRQIGFLKSLDYLGALAVTEMAVRKHDLYDWVIGPIRTHPYAFELGPIPEASGDSRTFKERVGALMSTARETYPQLFPLRPIVGVTLLYFESGQGKDLDNLLRLVVPEVMRCLEPPDEDQLYWSADSPLAVRQREGLGAAGHELQFVEAVALPRRPRSVTPGTAFLLLSDGWRHASWWAQAISYDEEFEAQDCY